MNTHVTINISAFLSYIVKDSDSKRSLDSLFLSGRTFESMRISHRHANNYLQRSLRCDRRSWALRGRHQR